MVLWWVWKGRKNLLSVIRDENPARPLPWHSPSAGLMLTEPDSQVSVHLPGRITPSGGRRDSSCYEEQLLLWGIPSHGRQRPPSLPHAEFSAPTEKESPTRGQRRARLPSLRVVLRRYRRHHLRTLRTRAGRTARRASPASESDRQERRRRDFRQELRPLPSPFACRVALSSLSCVAWRQALPDWLSAANGDGLGIAARRKGRAAAAASQDVGERPNCGNFWNAHCFAVPECWDLPYWCVYNGICRSEPKVRFALIEILPLIHLRGLS